MDLNICTTMIKNFGLCSGNIQIDTIQKRNAVSFKLTKKEVVLPGWLISQMMTMKKTNKPIAALKEAKAEMIIIDNHLGDRMKRNKMLILTLKTLMMLKLQKKNLKNFMKKMTISKQTSAKKHLNQDHFKNIKLLMLIIKMEWKQSLHCSQPQQTSQESFNKWMEMANLMLQAKKA